MLNCELIVGSRVFDVIEAAEWDVLAGQGMTNTPFQRYAYQKAWWTHLGEGELYTIVVRDGATLKGIGAFFLRNGCVAFNGSKEETDYLDIIAAEADAAAVWEKIIDCLCSSGFPTWQRLDLHCIPSASSTRVHLPRLAASRGFILSDAVEEVCPIIPLNGSFEDYLMSIDKKQRHEIRRKMRKAEVNGATVEVIQKGDDVHAAVDDFLALLQLSQDEKESWLNNGRSALFHDVAEVALAADMLQLMFLKINGERLAALFNFDYNGRIWVYNSGIDMSKHANLSLGVVLASEAINLAAEKGHTAFDFLRGDETYKYRFGAVDTEIHHIQIAQS